MATVRSALYFFGTTPNLVLWINRALESLWLLTVVLVPLAFLGRSYGEWSPILGSYELAKITLLKTFVALMTALWLTEWGLQLGSHTGSGLHRAGFLFRPKAWLIGLRAWLGSEPTRWLGLAATLYLGSTLLSTILSASFSVSMWGDIPGQDSYGGYTVVSYVILFGVIATHLRTRNQLWRLLGAISAMGVLLAAYAIFQHYDHDFLDLIEPPNTKRVSSTMGNAIFAGAVLLMTIPVSVMLAALSLKESLKVSGFWWKLSLWTMAITVQLLGIDFTLSRGPWFGTILALVVFFGLTAIFVGWRPLTRAALALGLAVIVAAAILSLPFQVGKDDAGQHQITTGGQVVERVAMVGRQSASGSIGGRVEIWEGSWRLMTNRPWFGFDSISLAPLRPLIGYGPDLFRSSYLLESPPGFRMLPSEPANAHNYFVHQGVELGFVGVITSFGVFVAFFLVGGAQLFWGRSSLSNGHKLVLAILLATVAGWLLQQMVGVARVSDLTLSWVLLGTFAALPIVMRDRPMPANFVPAPGRQQRSDPPMSRLRVREAPHRWSLLSGLVIIGLVVGIGLLTWTKSINYFRAAIIADQGAGQFRNGQLSVSMSSLDRAIKLAPEVSSYYDSRATVYRACRRENQDQQGSDHSPSTQSPSYAACGPEERYDRNQKWVEKRPFSYRARLNLADSALDLGLLNGDSGRIDESTKLYREVAEMVPTSWPLWNRLAEVYIQVGQSRSALPPLEKSLQLTGDTELSYEAFLLEAKAYHNLGQLLSAIEKSTLAVRHLPQSPEAHYIRGTSYYGLGQLGKALEDLDQAILLDPENGLAYNNRSLAYARMGRLNRAVEDFSQTVRLKPGLAIAYNNRGFAYRDLGKLDRAIEDLNHAIELDSEFALAYYNRALAYILLGEDSKAQRDGRLAVELGFDAASLEAAMTEVKKSVSPD